MVKTLDDQRGNVTDERIQAPTRLVRQLINAKKAEPQTLRMRNVVAEKLRTGFDCRVVDVGSIRLSIYVNR